MNTGVLNGRRVLIVEDEYFAVAELRGAFQECGARIVGPASEVNQALRLINEGPAPDCAVLDINLNGELVYPVAQELSRLGIPFVFATGFDSLSLPPEFREAPRCGKPLDTDRILSALSGRLSAPRAAPGSAGPKRSSKKLREYFPASDLEAIVPMLREVELTRGDLLVKEGEVIPAVYFFETAVASVTAVGANSRAIEVGMIGGEGMTDMVLREGDRAALRSTVLIAGSALRMEAADFVRALERPGLQRVMLAYKEALGVQFACAALSHGTATLDARLARWILMAHDRVEGDTIPIVHNTIADLLAVRRSGVTTAMHVLEGIGAIKSVRAQIIVKKRNALEELAAGAYGVQEAEHERLLSRAMETN